MVAVYSSDMDMKLYQTESRKTVADSLQRADAHVYFSYLVLGLVGESGEVADKVKKCIRDSGGVLSASGKEKLVDELGDVLWYVARLSEVLDVSLSDVATRNLEKLQSRMDRGAIHGSGDAR